mmetsp:Transcript_18029/g.39373  ORF Transcript_18029/g.39373 Transcript_18029/m.39373 type:complete len:204 (-) Transcript_18029:529-1140(-)
MAASGRSHWLQYATRSSRVMPRTCWMVGSRAYTLSLPYRILPSSRRGMLPGESLRCSSADSSRARVRSSLDSGNTGCVASWLRRSSRRGASSLSPRTEIARDPGPAFTSRSAARSSSASSSWRSGRAKVPPARCTSASTADSPNLSAGSAREPPFITRLPLTRPTSRSSKRNTRRPLDNTISVYSGTFTSLNVGNFDGIGGSA